ncbi:MAG: PHP domain-containing protein [Eubacteriales bacterium]|nr:PHP domain-containing protein [Eubacteriales bacterium]
MILKQAQASTHEPFDLHLHSNCSDGSDTPAQVVQAAYERGVTLIALTDHDNVLGVPEAMAEAERIGVRLLPSIEMDAEWPHEMHILGLDIDIEEPRMRAALVIALARRAERNTEIVARLLRIGIDIRASIAGEVGSATRLNIALALVKGGYAADTKEAFAKYLRKGCPGFFTAERFTPEEIIRLILGAGGVPVWAHPMNGHADPHKLVPLLKERGLQGVEGYHPSLSKGDSVVLTSIARQKGLIVTCGSDYHGAHRPEAVPGQTWRDSALLNECRAFFEARPQRKLADISAVGFEQATLNAE